MYAQVLSESVGHALTLFGGPEKAETAEFASMFDKFFDSLNSRNCVTAKQKRKVFLRPYFSGEDFRLNVSGIEYDCSYNTYNVKASVSEREKEGFMFYTCAHFTVAAEGLPWIFSRVEGKCIGKRKRRIHAGYDVSHQEDT